MHTMLVDWSYAEEIPMQYENLEYRNMENQVCRNALTGGTDFCNYCMP